MISWLKGMLKTTKRTNLGTEKVTKMTKTARATMVELMVRTQAGTKMKKRAAMQTMKTTRMTKKKKRAKRKFPRRTVKVKIKASLSLRMMRKVDVLLMLPKREQVLVRRQKLVLIWSKTLRQMIKSWASLRMGKKMA